jgi:hypothetical protein
MKYLFSCIIVSIQFFSGVVVACDACGSFIGIHPGDRKSYIGLNYRYGSFSGSETKKSAFFPDGNLRILHGDHHANSGNSAEEYEVYRGVELRARYYLHPRVELSIIVPFVFNSAFDNNKQSKNAGLGDVTTLVGYQLIDQANNGALSHRLLLGGGVKWASGNVNQQLNNERIDLLLQPGTGCTDALLYANYQMGIGKWSCYVLPTYKINGTNRFEEHVSNSTTLFSSVNYQWKESGNFKGLASAQCYYESMNGVLIREVRSKGTTMKGLFLGPGADLFYKRIGCSVSCLWNVYEEQRSNVLASRIRYRVGINWYFNQESFIFK